MTKKLTSVSPILQEIYSDALRQTLLTDYRTFGYRDNDEPTEEERARWRRRRENESAFWSAQEKKYADNPIMQLHSRDSVGNCVGCDFTGYEGEPPEWPCRTVRLVCTGDPDFEFKDDNVIDS